MSGFRTILHFLAFMSLAVPMAGVVPTGAAELPHGSSPTPIEMEHFPDAVHAVVFRNWGLVPISRIARTLGATDRQIEDIAQAMGLPAMDAQADLSADQLGKRIYISIVRRNWHLLPYDQLLTLLDMTADELAFALREDDFLFTKLGSLKPKCPPVRYAEPGPAARAAEDWIRRCIQEHFGDSIRQPGEPRLTFVERLSQTQPRSATPDDSDRITGSPRFVYSYFGMFGDPLLDAAAEPYPEGLLQKLADVGVNGVWLHVVLRQIAPPLIEPDDPQQDRRDRDARLANLQKLVQLARRYGISVYLYMNEPRAQPTASFEDDPSLAGVREGDFAALCTSHEAVRNWLSDSLSYVFTAVPDLGGVFSITASENLTHCASHGNWNQCPRCSVYTDAQIIAQVNTAIKNGVHRAAPNARVIAWDWGWRGHGDAPEHIALTPEDTWLMSVSEWGIPIERGDVKSTVGEYSISAVGPGPRAQHHWALAKNRGLKTIAKVQLNTTWELSSVPFLPVLDLVADHCVNLAQANVDGLMLSWSVGGYPSPNLQVAQYLFDHHEADRDEVLNAVARSRYGTAAAPHARRAWSRFSRAFTEYPFHVSVLYRGPQQMGPANLLFAKPTGYTATMVGFPYDDVDGWRGPYPARVLADQFERVATRWAEGIGDMQRVLETVDPPRRLDAQADLRIAEAAQLHFASVANQIRFVLARNAFLNEDLTRESRTRLRSSIADILDDEIRLAQSLYDLAKTDSRIGFEASNQYYYTPGDLVEKVLNCEWLKQRLLR